MFNHVLSPTPLFPNAFWPKISAVTVSPPSTTVGTGKTRQFSAFLNNVADPIVTWSLAAGGGSIDEDGIYTAPASAGSATVRATLTNETSKYAQAGVTISLSAVAEVSPASASIYAGQTQQFTATLDGDPDDFVWSVVSGGGSISATGLYTAPAGATTAVIRATWADNVAVYDESTVTVSVASGSGVVLSPSAATIAGGLAQQFSATVDGSPSDAVHWSVRSGDGSISSRGTYYSPINGTTATIRATLISDPSVYGEETITVSENAETTVIVSDGPTTLSFTYSTGAPLGSDPEEAATVVVSAPGYVSAPKTFVGGTLTVRPIGVGTATLSVSYDDPENGPTTVTRTITVVKE